MSGLLLVVVCLGATGFAALSTALKHRSATTVPDPHGQGTRGLRRFVAATVRSPLWLIGILADIGAVALQVAALHLGPLAVVQPVLTTGLVSSLLVAHALARTRPSRRELLWAGVLAASIAGFLAVSGATSARVTGPAQTADRGAALVAGTLAVVLAAAGVFVARRLPRGAAAAVTGVAVGTTYACTAALIKATTNIAAHGPAAVLTSWQLYVLVASGAAGLLLGQLAFSAGPLTASLPATATVDPLVAVALGITVYDERLRSGPYALAGEVACLLLLAASAVVLSRQAAAAGR